MRFFIELSYNGKYFFGWQIQKNKITIEGKLEYCLSKLLNTSINVIGAGRTDRGVHAKQMFAHFDYNKSIDFNIIKKINLFLPTSIKVSNFFIVKENIHARYDVISRVYEYYISFEKNPFIQNFSWYCFYSLNLDKIFLASKLLLNYQDFKPFSKRNNKNIKNNNKCFIYNISWKRKKEILCFTIESNRFLRSMVRSIIGTLINVGRGKITIDNFTKILELKKNNFPKLIAPPNGLFLSKINYPKKIFLKKLNFIY